MNELNQIKEEYVKKQQELFDEFSKKIESVKKENPYKLEYEQKYWYIDSAGQVSFSHFKNDFIDNYRLIKNIVWLNEDDCIKYNKIDKQFRQLVYEENLKNPIDWNKKTQYKYYIFIGMDNNRLESCWNTINKSIVIYCSNKCILDLAIALIGEEDLKWYIKNYRA